MALEQVKQKAKYSLLEKLKQKGMPEAPNSAPSPFDEEEAGVMDVDLQDPESSEVNPSPKKKRPIVTSEAY